MFHHNITFSNNALYNHKQWSISSAENLGPDNFSSRYRREVITYANNSSTPHPTIPGLIKGTPSMFYTRGKTITKWCWPEGDSPANCNTATAIANYKSYVESFVANEGFANSSNITFTEETANSITLAIEYKHDDFSYRTTPVMYVPDSKKSTTTFENNVTLVCWLNVNGTVEYYNPRLTDLREGVQRTFKKFDNECYIVFSANVVTDGGTQLNQYQMYKMQSNTITATPSANGKAIYYHGQPD
jgi:hypothetical protein